MINFTIWQNTNNKRLKHMNFDKIKGSFNFLDYYPTFEGEMDISQIPGTDENVLNTLLLRFGGIGKDSEHLLLKDMFGNSRPLETGDIIQLEDIYYYANKYNWKNITSEVLEQAEAWIYREKLLDLLDDRGWDYTSDTRYHLLMILGNREIDISLNDKDAIHDLYQEIINW